MDEQVALRLPRSAPCTARHFPVQRQTSHRPAPDKGSRLEFPDIDRQNLFVVLQCNISRDETGEQVGMLKVRR
jgi:hypothetical protein